MDEVFFGRGGLYVVVVQYEGRVTFFLRTIGGYRAQPCAIAFVYVGLGWFIVPICDRGFRFWTGLFTGHFTGLGVGANVFSIFVGVTGKQVFYVSTRCRNFDVVVVL